MRLRNFFKFALDDKTAHVQLEEEKVEAVITVPEGYTLVALNKSLLHEGTVRC